MKRRGHVDGSAVGSTAIVVVSLGLTSCGSRSGLFAELVSEPPVDGGSDTTLDADGDGEADDAGPDSSAGPDAACNPGNCRGCCKPDGTCVFPARPDACGANGEACVTCPSGPDISCNKPTPGCNRQLAACTSENCDGCCVLFPKPTWQFCSTGTHANACGHAGEACQICGSGQCAPVSNGGQCVGAPPCSPQNCTGCCFGDVCAFGVQDIACGASGAVCKDCTSSGRTCAAGTCI